MQKGDGGHTHEWDDAVTADGTPVTLAQMRGRDVSHLIQELDGYLCELAGAQIRDGLHILGQVPEGEQMVGLLPGPDAHPEPRSAQPARGRCRACFGLELDALLAERGRRARSRASDPHAGWPTGRWSRRQTLWKPSTNCAGICSLLLAATGLPSAETIESCARGDIPRPRCR